MVFVYALTLFTMSYDLFQVFRSDVKERLIKNKNAMRLFIISIANLLMIAIINFDHFTGKLLVSGAVSIALILLYLMPKSLGGGDVKLMIVLSLASPSPLLFVFSVLIFQGMHIWLSAIKKWWNKEKPYFGGIYIMGPSIVIGYIVSTVGLLFVM